MKSLSRTSWLLLGALALLFSASQTFGEVKEKETVQIDPQGWKDAIALWNALDAKLDMREFKETMTLREALSLLYEQLSSKDLEVPVLVDTEAFQEGLPKAKADFDVWETKISYKGVPRYIPAHHFLKLTLRQIPSGNATWLIRRNFVEITTVKRAEGVWISPSITGGIIGGKTKRIEGA